MRIPTWRDPNRKRRLDIRYSDPDFSKYYDIDLEDFTALVLKLKQGEKLTEIENDRYGNYILAICIIVMEGPKFRTKTRAEKEEVLEQQYMELLPGLKLFNPDKGKIYSYAYRIGYTAACHYYTNKIEQHKRQEAIDNHCQEEYDLYLDEYATHKVNTHE